jgi:nucleoside phosphorylase
LSVLIFRLVPAFAETAILVALPSEQTALSLQIRVVGKPVELAGHRISIGYHRGEKVYLVKTGAGNLSSAMITQALLTRYKVDRLISIGVAGNLNDQWAVGYVMCVTNVTSHQVGKETPSGLETMEEQSAVSHRLSAEYMAKCEALRGNAVEIAQSLLNAGQRTTTNGTTEIAAHTRGVLSNSAPRQVLLGTGQARNDNKGEKSSVFATLREGRLVSGDSFIASTEKRKWLRETFHADAVDMVSVGIARVCEANGVPYVIIRALSDNANESASADFAAFVQKYKEPVTATIAVGIIDRVAAATTHSPPKSER